MADDAVTDSGSRSYSALGQTRLIRTVFIAALLLLAGVAALAYYSINQNAENARWVDHTYQVTIETGQVFSDLRGATATARGYLMTGDPALLVLYRQYSAAIPPRIGTLRSLVVDNPAQVERADRLRGLAEQELAGLAQMVAGHLSGAAPPDPKAVAPVMESHHQMDELAALTQQMAAEEDRLLERRRAEAARGRRVTSWVVVTGNAVSLLALLACLWLLVREITYRHRTERQVKSLNTELASRNGMLEASNRELEGFSYSISHDLRSPLRAMDGYAALLERRYSPQLEPEAKRLLGVVRDNTRHMAALIDDLLTFSRLGRQALALEPLDMTALATQCVAEVLQVNGNRPLVVVAPLPPCGGDHSLVRQVWMNIVGNAVKYSSVNAGARIEILGRVQDRECVYSVCDNGVGFDMQYYHKLFGVFQRLHGVEEFPGTGVGLAIAMRIVTKHGGRIWAEGAPGQGATFFFTMPHTEDV